MEPKASRRRETCLFCFPRFDHPLNGHDQIQRQEEKANAKIEILNQAHAAQMAALEAQDSDVEDEPSSSDESLVARARD